MSSILLQSFGRKVSGESNAGQAKDCRWEGLKFCFPNKSVDRYNCVKLESSLFWWVLVCLQAGNYVWLTYKEVYDIVVKIGQSIRTSGVNPVSLVLIMS